MVSVGESSPSQATSNISDPQNLDTSSRQSEQPWAWADPTFLYCPANEVALYLGGWRERTAKWEDYPLRSSSDLDQPIDFPYSCLDDHSGYQKSPQWSFLEFLIPAEGDSADWLWKLAAESLGLSDYKKLKILPVIGSRSPTSNRTLSAECTRILDTEVNVADLSFTSLPNSRGERSRQLQYATRHLRLISTETALVCVWDAAVGCWEPEFVTWPHHAIPRLSSETIHLLNNATCISEVLRYFLLECLTHEEYCLRSWRTELDHWETWIFTAMAEGSDVLRDLNLGPDVRARAGALSSYLNAVQLDLRTLERRLQVEPLFQKVSTDSEIVEKLNQAKNVLSENQGHRREAHSLLASLAAGEQLQVARDQAEATALQARATARLESTLVWLGALLLLPGLVVGVYGANLRELDPSVNGTLPMLALWTLLASSVFALVISFLISPRGRAPRIMTGIGIVTTLAAFLLARLLSRQVEVNIYWILAAVVSVTWLVGIVTQWLRRSSVMKKTEE